MPDGFVAATRAAEVPPGAMRSVTLDRERVLIANVGGVFHAMRDSCGHQGATLAPGTLFGYVVECPLHYACYDLRTGKLLSGPRGLDLPTYRVVVEDDTVFVERPGDAPSTP